MNELSAHLDRALRERPTDESTIVLKADFLKTLGKSPHAISLLEKHWEKNQGTTLIVRVLAETLLQDGKVQDALNVLRSALLIAPGDKSINLLMAKALIADSELASTESILAHLRRSFTDGDSSYEARLLFARCHMLYGDLDRGRAEFDALRRTYLDSRPTAVVMDERGVPKRYSGRVAKKQFGYGFIVSNDLRFDVFVHRNRAVGDLWERIDRDTRVSFLLGFSFRGPTPIAIQLE